MMSTRNVARCLAATLAGALVAWTVAQDNAPTSSPVKEQSQPARTAVSKDATRAVASPEAAAEAPPRVIFDIRRGRLNWGRITIELDPEHAPKTVANFLEYVDAGYYDGTVFHRVIPKYMVQGGGQLANGNLKTDGLRPPIKNESDNGLLNLTGTIAMARRHGHPDSATSQFFLNLKDNPGLDYGCPAGDGSGYCVFGKVVGGQRVLERFRRLPTRRDPKMSFERSQPVNPPMIARAYRAEPLDRGDDEDGPNSTPTTQPVTRPVRKPVPPVEPEEQIDEEADPEDHPEADPEENEPDPEEDPEADPED
jgi:cyclophilin family peptidyl-prolyl cis-trans isomerase